MWQGNDAPKLSFWEGKPFFLLFKNETPEKSVLERTSIWALNDLEHVR